MMVLVATLVQTCVLAAFLGLVAGPLQALRLVQDSFAMPTYPNPHHIQTWAIAFILETLAPSMINRFRTWIGRHLAGGTHGPVV